MLKAVVLPCSLSVTQRPARPEMIRGVSSFRNLWVDRCPRSVANWFCIAGVSFKRFCKLCVEGFVVCGRRENYVALA